MKRFVLLAAVALLAGCSGGTGNEAATVDNSPLATIPAPNGGDWTKMVSETPAGGMLMGNPNAKVKVVEYSSMTCPHCAHFAENGVPSLVADYVKTGQVAFELRNFVRDPLDISMALVARCNGAGPQFFALTDALFKEQEALIDRLGSVPEAQIKQLGSLPPAQQFGRLAALSGLTDAAAKRGLPADKAAQCLANKAETDKLVRMNSDAVTKYKLEGTPTFLINDKVVDLGAIAEDKVWETLERRIREALA